MLTLLLSGLSGWVLLVLLGATTALPRALGRAGRAASGPARMVPRGHSAINPLTRRLPTAQRVNSMRAEPAQQRCRRQAGERFLSIIP